MGCHRWLWRPHRSLPSLSLSLLWTPLAHSCRRGEEGDGNEGKLINVCIYMRINELKRVKVYYMLHNNIWWNLEHIMVVIWVTIVWFRINGFILQCQSFKLSSQTVVTLTVSFLQTFVKPKSCTKMMNPMGDSSLVKLKWCHVLLVQKWIINLNFQGNPTSLYILNPYGWYLYINLNFQRSQSNA